MLFNIVEANREILLLFFFSFFSHWHVSFSDLHYGSCELKIPLRTLRDHAVLTVFGRLAAMVLDARHPST